MKIIVIDDDPLVIMSLKTILTSMDYDVVGTGETAEEAVKLYKKLYPDLVLMDIRMKGKTGIDATEEILKLDREAKILLLTTFNDEEYISKVMALGCRGYILKHNIDSLGPSLETIAQGNIVLDSEVIENFKRTQARNLDESLTERDIEILKQIAEGFNNREIAQTLYLSEGTVKNYISIILEKLHLRDRTQLAIYYLKSSE